MSIRLAYSCLSREKDYPESFMDYKTVFRYDSVGVLLVLEGILVLSDLMSDGHAH